MTPTAGIEGLIETLHESITMARPNGFRGLADVHTVESAESGLAGPGHGRSILAVEIARTFIEQRILRESSDPGNSSAIQINADKTRVPDETKTWKPNPEE